MVAPGVVRPTEATKSAEALAEWTPSAGCSAWASSLAPDASFALAPSLMLNSTAAVASSSPPMAALETTDRGQQAAWF